MTVELQSALLGDPLLLYSGLCLSVVHKIFWEIFGAVADPARVDRVATPLPPLTKT